jgi:hypothetical protein
MRLDSLKLLPPVLLARIGADVLLIAAWVVLASDHLPGALAGAGAAVFGSVIAWFWASSGVRQLAPAESQTTTPVDGVTRLTSFLRPTDDTKATALRDPETGLYQPWYVRQRIDEEAQRCSRYDLSMAVMVVKLKPAKLGDWNWEKESKAVIQTLHLPDEMDLAAALRPFEIAACLVHCDRDGAEQILQSLSEVLPSGGWEAGIAVYPEGNADSDAMIELARMRATPVVRPRPVAPTEPEEETPTAASGGR